MSFYEIPQSPLTLSKYLALKDYPGYSRREKGLAFLNNS